MLRYILSAGAVLPILFSHSAVAANDADLEKIHSEIQQLKQSYESRIQALEERLKQAESTAKTAQTTAAQADEKATQVAAAPPPTVPSGSNAFNPDISLILSGIYSNLSQDPANYRITGFMPSGDIGPGKRGFSLAETELGIYANIDPHFYGGLNFSMAPDNTTSVEEAFIQTVGLSKGLTFKAGRFFSAIGYLNERHAHTWDFVDNPLTYQAFLGTQLGQDGVQVKWLAPTATAIELGAEVGRGQNFPGTNRNKNGAGDVALFGHVGGDVGVDNSWRAGLSYLHTAPSDRQYNDTNLAGGSVANSFSGTSKLWIADFIWKWAPQGNPVRTNLTLQGEYFQRKENGRVTYDTAATNATGAYATSQSGWYTQAVYQFAPYWRVGVRRDQLDSGSVDYGLNNANLARPSYSPSKNSVMLDYNPSEFSRIRFQVAQDKSRQGAIDNQVFLQYQMSLGAHGAHQF
jgi:outer membrane murein-binding lipoprotein Lpp